VVRYVQLAHNRRVDGKTQAEVLVNLGREDRLDLDGLRRLARSITRYLGEEEVAPSVVASDGSLQPVASRSAGSVWLLDGLWRRLGVAGALARVLGARRFTTDVERVLFALVANRAVEPCSKLAAAEWASHDVAVPGLQEMDEDHAYRAMDLLVDADVAGEVQQAVFFTVADLLNLEVDLIPFDTTSTYFERDEEETGDGAFRVFGHSKDHRPDLPQVVIGLAVTREGIPVRVWVWPGNTNDHTILPEVKDDLRGWRLGRVVTVVDRGLSSQENLRYLQRAGGHFIAGERMRDGSAAAQEALTRQGRYQTVRDDLRVKEVRLGSGAATRWVVCHNPVEAERDRSARADTIARLERRAGADRHRPRAHRQARQDQAAQRGGSGAHQSRVRSARPSLPGPLSPSDRRRPAAHRSRQGQGRGATRRQVPAIHLRPRSHARGCRARLQELARSRTRVPRPQDLWGAKIGSALLPGVS
jgi:hypothetical protein